MPAYAWNFHEMFRHSELYQIVAFDVHHERIQGGGRPCRPQYHWPATDPRGGEQPVINAGSDTFPLDVAAAWTDDGQALTVAVINPTESSQTLDIRCRAGRFFAVWRRRA